MSNELTVSEVVEKVTSFIGEQEGRFVKLNENGINRLDFAKEAEFAKQLLLKNDYTLNIARGNPDSLLAAISNVAAIGITLNPALSFAYLVPRKVNKKQSICLDISYRGFIKLATDTGVIKSMKAELVYKADEFKYHGFHKEPEFSANPFGDRGDLIGVYAMAQLTDGGVLVETMTIDAVNAIRNDSEAYKSALADGEDSWSYKNNVWVKYYTEMVKKTVIKRAYKTLPTSRGTEILGQAIDVVNQHEGIEFDEPKQLPQITYTDEEHAEYKRCIESDDYFNLFALKRSLNIEGQSQLHDLCVPKAERGMIGKAKQEEARRLKEAELQVDSCINLLIEAADGGDDAGVQELIQDMSQWTLDYVLDRVNQEQRIFINKIKETA